MFCFVLVHSISGVTSRPLCSRRALHSRYCVKVASLQDLDGVQDEGMDDDGIPGQGQEQF
jgi:hypothetical protein